MMIRSGHFLLLAVFAVFGTQGLFAVDTVTRRSDRAVFRGELTSITRSTLTIKLQSGQEEQISVANVAAVRFDDEPAELAQARSNERSGALDRALEKYTQIELDYSGDNRNVKTELSFLIARTRVLSALASPESRDIAIKAIDDFRTGNSSNFRYYEATLLHAEILSQDAAGVEKAQQLLTEIQSCDVPGFQLKAGVQLGFLLLQGGDTAGAISAFDKVIADSGNDESAIAARYEGMLGRGMSLKQDGKSGEAVSVLEEIISGASESESRTLARAWVLKGDCLREQGQPKDALFAYLFVDVLYSSEPAAHAAALYHLSTLWGPAGYQNRADEARAALTSRYPNSPWAGR
jgi:tetratricopeptide (TPR) repeat protein